jgi:hypothetical protein
MEGHLTAVKLLLESGLKWMHGMSKIVRRLSSEPRITTGRMLESFYSTAEAMLMHETGTDTQH